MFEKKKKDYNYKTSYAVLKSQHTNCWQIGSDCLKQISMPVLFV